MKLGLLMSLLLLLCQVSPSAQVRTDSTEADILETVFRYQIAHCHKPRALRKYFLSYKGQDLSDVLMARFKSDGSRIKTRSQMSGFKDRDTGERGIILDIGSIDWQNDGSVKVAGSCVAADLDAHLYVYRVLRKNGKWTVTRSKLRGFS